MEINQILLGVLGGTIPLVLKYFVDHLTEKRRVDLSFTAKRRERYHEKQMAAIEDAYELLVGYVAICKSIYLHETNESLKDKIERAEKMRDEFQSVFDRQVIYLPPEMVNSLSMVSYQLRRIHGLAKWKPLTDSLNKDSNMCEEDVRLVELKVDLRISFDQLQRIFREHMSQEMPPLSKSTLKLLRELSDLIGDPRKPTSESQGGHSDL